MSRSVVPNDRSESSNAELASELGGHRHPDKVSQLQPQVLKPEEGTITAQEYQRRIAEQVEEPENE